LKREYRDLRDRGWFFVEQDAKVSALILDDDYGLIAHDDDLLSTFNSEMKLVCTPWPPEEDEERLRPIRAELEQSLVKRETTRREHAEQQKQQRA
jgi:hypothetical protein